MSGLVTFLKPHRDKAFGSQPLRKAVDAFFEGEERGEAFLFSPTNHCEHFPIHTPEDFIEYYRMLLSLLFLRKFHKKKDEKLDNQIRSLIFRGRTEGFGKQFYLQQGYDVLATFLFENKKEALNFTQLEKGAILHNQVPHLLQCGELGLISLYFGLISSDDALLHKGLKCVEFSLSLCDHRGEFFQGLWQNEADYKMVSQGETFPFLFQVASQLVASSKLQGVSESSGERLYSDPFIRLFNHAFKEVTFPQLSQRLTLHDIDRSLGFLHYQCGETSLVCSAAGINTGLSSIHKKGIHIVSMGPHYAPLADSDYYGIFRLSNGSQEGFKDLTIESDDERGKFQGWTRVVSPQEEDQSKDWLFFNLESEKEKIDLTIRKSHHNALAPLFYVFFVSADKACVGDEVELFPGMLDRYQGSVDKVFFKKGKETLEIISHFESEMQVIPLAGKDHFWSADFLLVFSLKKKLYPYRWTVI
ncbi:MAG: hypothetical protein QNJ27_02025 [Simkaniaceae bacterium]|nr:hypothetical protein [Simkaniaceae bacterium]